MKVNFSDLKNKVVVIAGATGLIGKELSEGFVEQGSIVILSSRNTKKGKQLKNKLNKLKDGKVFYHPVDISSEVSVKALIKFTLKTFKKIDIFVNCSWPKTKGRLKNVDEIPFKSVKEDLLSHLGGYFLCTQKMALQMKKQRSGVILNFSSIYGIVGPNFSIYNSTKITCPPAYPLIKGGIISMTKYFATYFAKYNIRINCICPGGVFNKHDKVFVKNYSKLTPLGRMARSNEIVSGALFLSSEASSYVTGDCLMIDGGWTAW
ncbi:MAG: SDR family oxidoreductase [Candidatus Omnitrophica bacterium]|nr:SDR family oxidoreductase [Candidatus Omnitrophota bacterium]